MWDLTLSEHLSVFLEGLANSSEFNISIQLKQNLLEIVGVGLTGVK